VTITHDDILARVTETWLEAVPGRRKLAKRSLPSHANDLTLNVLVVAGKNDTCNLDLCSEFLQRHWKPRFDMAHVPGEFVWQLVTPDGRRLMLFTWINWRRNSHQMFVDFCQETGREVGTLSPDGSIQIGSTTISLRRCKLLHEDECRRRQATVIKARPARTLLLKAEELLKSSASQCEEIDCREFYDDEEAHDDQLQESLEGMFLKNCAKYEKAITQKYGAPAMEGTTEHCDLPLNGVLRYFIWSIKEKMLYLAVCHEDRELPWVVCLGTIV
jgi:hypothetical protein